jgi:hypothetical protein
MVRGLWKKEFVWTFEFEKPVREDRDRNSFWYWSNFPVLSGIAAGLLWYGIAALRTLG